MDAGLKKQYFKILAEELVPALGCTEPIAIALASAKAREVLGVMPERIVAKCSGNLVKNVKCVIVPNTDDLIGIEASAITGAVGGDCSKGMEVLGGDTKEQILEANNLYKKGICSVELLDTPLNLHLIIEAYAGNDKATVEVKNLHDNITFVSRNGETLYESDGQDGLYYGVLTDRSVLTFDRIYDFAETTPIDELKAVFKAQVEDNMAIAEEGLTGKYGVGIGAALIANDKSVFGKVKAYASAASEARMSGCVLPVVTNSGSGNQGITASVPVIVYAEEQGLGEEKLYRALALSNLLTVYQKTFIGRLSAFCGAVSAAAASGSAITYLAGGTLDQIKMTLVNALANVSGIVCDGAKASCGAKISAGLDAAITGHYLAMRNKFYRPHTGILQSDVDLTIGAVGRMAMEGMRDTDRVILKIMLGL